MGERGGMRVAVALAGALTMTVTLSATLMACNSQTKLNRKVNVSSIPVFSPTAPEPTATVSIPLPSSSAGPSGAATSPSVTVHPAPSSPIRTAHVNASGRQYDIAVWAEVSNVDCAEHSYGQVQTFLEQHACRGLSRELATTTVQGRAVGFDVVSLSIPGTTSDPYANASAFRTLVEADGSGSVNDLLREGYRLPSGPTAVPSPDAFRCLTQDTGVNIYDIWYLDGPTPNNDPALEQMAQDIYLAY